jgi:hypothetical protein
VSFNKIKIFIYCYFAFGFVILSDAANKTSTTIEQEKNYLMSYEKFISLKPYQQAYYLRQVREIFSELSGNQDFFSLFWHNNLRDFIEILIGQEAKAEGSGFDDLPDIDPIDAAKARQQQKLDKFYKQVIELNHFLERKNLEDGDVREFGSELEKIKAFAKQFVKPDLNKEQYNKVVLEFDSLQKNLKIRIDKYKLSRFKKFVAPVETLKEQFEEIRNEIQQAILNKEEHKKLQEKKFRCIYAGFVIEGDKCRPLKETKIYGDKAIGYSNSNEILCNPLFYGFKYSGKRQNQTEENFKCVGNSGFGGMPDANDKFEGYCVPRGRNASKNCAEVSGSEGICVAQKYINSSFSNKWNGKLEWSAFNSKLVKLCSPAGLNKDLTTTCEVLAQQMAQIKIDVQTGYQQFTNKKESKVAQ